MARRLSELGLVVLVIMVLSAPEAVAQRIDEYHPVQWWWPLMLAGGTVVVFAMDEPVQNAVQDNRSEDLDEMADVMSTFKDPKVFGVAVGGLLAAGLVTQEYAVARTGLQVAAAYGLSSAFFYSAKWLFGRSRPSDVESAWEFDWLSGGETASFASGSSAVVFSLAATLADAIDHPAASVVLYTGAALNSWSRVNDNRHWVSDVAVGAVMGIAAAKLVNGKWRVFGIAPPNFLINPHGGAQLAWNVGF